MYDDMLRDFLAFSQRQYDCLGSDPPHIGAIGLQDGRNRSGEGSLWLSTLCMAYYNTASAWVAFNHVPTVACLPDWCARLPIAKQRRNLLGGRLLKHISDFAEQVGYYGSIWDFLTHGFTGDPEGDWYVLQDTVRSVWGNGRWSSYTQTEMYQKANDLPVFPTCIDNDGSSGPRTGIQMVMGDVDSREDISKKEKLDILDDYADTLYGIVEEELNSYVPYLWYEGYMDYAMMESDLCNFQSLVKGQYYVGKGIDLQLGRALKTERVAEELGIDVQCMDDIWDLREEWFDPEYLGELQGWDGTPAYAKQYYRDHGVIASHYEIRQCLGIK